MAETMTAGPMAPLKLGQPVAEFELETFEPTRGDFGK
jgi:hypothetical protein